MASPIVTKVASQLATTVYTFVGVVTVFTIIAFLAARTFGKTKDSRYAIWVVVYAIGLVAGYFVYQARARGIGQ